MSPARVNAALERLRGDFPLEQRLRDAPEAVRAAYLEVLEHWRQHGRPPAAHGLDDRTLEQMTALDAVADQALGLGCYPFSAAPGGITVTVADGAPVAAMCAVDALAIPMLSGAHSRIEAPCSHCREPLSLEGGPDGVNDTATIRVHYRPRRTETAPCCTSLCDGITFVCARCAPAEHADYLRLDEADRVAREFFAFQRTWLDSESSSTRSN